MSMVVFGVPRQECQSEINLHLRGMVARWSMVEACPMLAACETMRGRKPWLRDIVAADHTSGPVC